LVDSVDAGPCEAWPNPLDLGLFHPGPRERVRQELGLGQLDILFLATAENLADPRKGIDLLEETWGQIRKTPGLRLGLVGRNCPERLAQDPQVFALGSVAAEKRVAELMAAADLFVHPAQVESYGLVLEEAQACGTPVVAFAGGGVGETLEKGKTGWLLPDRSAEALVGFLQMILADRNGLQKQRATCRAFMQHKHGDEAFQAQWGSLIPKLAG
jgi:glycosyltransferase involved in cell wall biosynthesis